MHNRIIQTLNVMFESIWKSNPPISVSFVSNSSGVKDIFVYLRPNPTLSSASLQSVMNVLKSNQSSFDEMMQVILRLPVLCWIGGFTCRKSPM